MGWSVSYQFLRAQLPTASELAGLREVEDAAKKLLWDGEGFALQIRRAASADLVVAEGISKLGHSVDESDDAGQIAKVINDSLSALPGAMLRLHDDYGVFGIDDDGRCSLDGTPSADTVDVDPSEFARLTELLPPSRAALPASLTKALAAHPRIASDTVVFQALIALGRLDSDDPRKDAVRSLLGTVPAMRVASVGLQRYASIGGYYAAAEYLAEVVDGIEEVAPLVDAFLGMWREPKGLYYYGEMQWKGATLDRLSQLPAVRAQMESDISRAEQRASRDEDLSFRRSEHAVLYLARSGERRAIASLIRLLRQWREQNCHLGFRLHVLYGTLNALGQFAHPMTFATLALELSSCDPDLRARDRVLEGMARVDPDRALTWLQRLAARQAGMVGICDALALVDRDEARALLRSLCSYPHDRTRVHARRALGIDLCESVAEPEIGTLLTHADANVRVEALECLASQAMPSMFRTLLLAESLHRALNRRFNILNVAPGFRGYERHGVPEQVALGSSRKALEWLESEGGAVLGEQHVVPELVSVETLGADAVALAYAEPRPALSADERDALLDEEQRALDELTGDDKT